MNVLLTGVLGAGALFLSGLATAAAAPIAQFLPEGVKYDERIPTPDDFLGFGLGDRPVRHDRMADYLNAVAAASDRIAVETIGETHEGRPILFFTVSAPENLARIEEIQSAHLARLDAAAMGEVGGEVGGDADTDGPLVVWINYGVHGAESAGMDAVMPSLYHLAAATGDDMDQMLADTIILIVGILNPDGHSRRANHVETFMSRVPVKDPAHEQHQLWIEARTNHYWFDLNRQWLLMTQPEAKAWAGTWQKWKPAVSADYHEMGSNASYYFHPGEPKRLNPLIPPAARRLAAGIAELHAAFFDSEQQLYYSNHGFDNFYVGKGSTYPQVNGSLGILFEAGAARGGAINTPAGERTYADNIRSHFRTTLSTLRGAQRLRDEILSYQLGFFEAAREDAAKDKRGAFVFSARGDTARLARFVALLRAHDIDVHALAQPVEAEGRRFNPGTSYIVPLAQPQYRMVRAIFDRVTRFEENVFYDVSGWTLPLAYDLEMAALSREGGGAASYSGALLGDADSAPVPTAAMAPGESAYGYLLDWRARFAPRALNRLLDAGIRVRIAQEAVSLPTAEGSVSAGMGSVFVPLNRQEVSKEIIEEIVRTIPEADGVPVHSVTSGAAPGAEAVGGPSFSPVEVPKVVLAFDAGISRTDAGEVWHLLDHEMEVPVLLRRKDELGGLDWSDYTHLILPGGRGAQLDEDIADAVAEWVEQDGGTVIALRQAAYWAEETWFTEEDEEDGNDNGASEGEETPERLDYADMSLRDAEHIIGGAIVAGDVDPSHPLGYGYTDRFLPVHRNTVETLNWPDDNPFGVAVAYAGKDDFILSGYVSEKRVEEIAGTPMAVAYRKGRGRVILLADDVAFRATFPGSERLLLNAVFFSSLIDMPSGEYAATHDTH